MKTLVEGPLFLAVQDGQPFELFPCLLVPSRLHQRSHVEAPEEGPDASIVILVRKIEVPETVVFPPVRVSRSQGRVDGLDRIGRSNAVSVYEVEDRVALGFVGYAAKQAQEVSEAVEPLSEPPEGQIRKIIGLVLEQAFPGKKCLVAQCFHARFVEAPGAETEGDAAPDPPVSPIPGSLN